MITERYRTRIALALQTTASAAQGYVLPTPAASRITVRCLATMGNAADLTLSLKTADNAAGTNAAAVAVDVPIFVNGVREATDAKSYAVTEATGNFIVDFIVDPALIPDDKYIGVHYADSNAANLVVCEVIENVAYRPTAS